MASEAEFLVVRKPEYDVLAKSLGLTRLEFLNHSVSLMKHVMNEIAAGNKIYAVNPDTKEQHELSMKALETIVPPVATRMLQAVTTKPRENPFAIESKG